MDAAELPKPGWAFVTADDVRRRHEKDTGFKACWQEYAELEELPADPDAPMPRRTVADHRRAMLHFFSCGLVHHEQTRRQLEEKLPASPRATQKRRGA